MRNVRKVLKDKRKQPPMTTQNAKWNKEKGKGKAVNKHKY